jgi:hypothetical protein
LEQSGVEDLLRIRRGPQQATQQQRESERPAAARERGERRESEKSADLAR